MGLHVVRIVAVLAFALSACAKKDRAAETSPGLKPAAPPNPVSTEPIGTHEPTSPSGHGDTMPTHGEDAPSVAGAVLERIDAAGYTYLRIQGASGELWAAVPETTVAVGAQVNVESAMPMHGFESKTLNRRWDVIYFGTLGDAPAAAPKRTAPSITTDTTAIKVERAKGANARSVAEVFAERKALAGKPVAIRAQVVKVTTGVMGKNWLHVRDGTGTATGQDNDLTVTTEASAAVGDVLTIEGTVGVNRDFGAGYLYPVIVEDARITR